MIELAHPTKAYVRVAVSASDDLTAGTVAVGFAAIGAPASAVTTWIAGGWADGNWAPLPAQLAGARWVMYARALVDSAALAAGQWQAWVRVLDAPEELYLRAAAVTVS